MEKTLVGKDGWLFLKNDGCKELEVHCNNLCIPNEARQRSRYSPHLDKYCITIFPNKSFMYAAYLPDEYPVKYRPGFDVYKNIFGDRLLDGCEVLKGEDETFYKTDTHINFRGAYLVYCSWIRHVNQLFSLNLQAVDIPIIRKTVPSLSGLGIGIGDLTWPLNCGSTIIADTSDVYFYSDTAVAESPYMKYRVGAGSIRLLTSALEDITDSYNGKLLDWPILSSCILFIRNAGAIGKRVLIFYDSFLISTMSLYMNIFNETYMAKKIYDPALVDLVKPDYVFEFRAERFLL